LVFYHLPKGKNIFKVLILNGDYIYNCIDFKFCHKYMTELNFYRLLKKDRVSENKAD